MLRLQCPLCFPLGPNTQGVTNVPVIDVTVVLRQLKGLIKLQILNYVTSCNLRWYLFVIPLFVPIRCDKNDMAMHKGGIKVDPYELRKWIISLIVAVIELIEAHGHPTDMASSIPREFLSKFSTWPRMQLYFLPLGTSQTSRGRECCFSVHFDSIRSEWRVPKEDNTGPILLPEKAWH